MVPLLAATAAWADPPAQGVTLTIDAYGTPLMGHVIVDADALAASGVTLFVVDEARTGKEVPYELGMTVKGLPQGTRIVQDAVDALMYFDANHDNYLDAADPTWALLSLFVDKNGDANAQVGEIRKLGDLGIEAISRYGSVRMKERTR